jgi:hypothetical protein
MHFERRFTTSGQDAYANIEFRSATSEIRNPDGTIVFQAENIEVPGPVFTGCNRHSGAEIFSQGRVFLQP